MSAQQSLAPALGERRHVAGRITGVVRRRPLASFFVLAYALSWWPAIIYAVTGSGPTLLSCGPALAAVAVLSVTRGKGGLYALLRSMLRWRVGLRWWTVAIFGPVVLTVAATALNLALGAEMPASSDWSRWTNVLPTALIILLVPVIGGAWEEPGWRGYSLPRLLERRSALTASLALGVIWAFWHLPIFLTGKQHWSDLLLIPAATVVFTWLFKNVQYSVLLAMVFHAMNNAVSGEYFSQMFSGADSTRQSWMLVIVWFVAAALVVRFARGFRRPEKPPAAVADR